MKLPENRFKRALAEGRHQLGLWSTLSSPYAAEVLADCGFDWLLLDTEHSPSDPITVLGQLQAVAPYAVSPIVRVAGNDTVLIKRFLDVGAQTLLVPFVQNAEEARQAVAAMHFPPRGVRGVASLTRASRFGRIDGYAGIASQEMCLLVQVETVEALGEIEAIAAVDGVDGIFVGPGDLSASMGYIGQPSHPEVKKATFDAIARIRACGKPAGILTGDQEFAAACIKAGTLFTAVGLDVGIMARGAEKLAAHFRAL
jgi:4-hydroxy-2-oxoheptanedioate aldolase